MLETFYPDRYEKDAYGIPYKKLYEKGYRGIIFDVDNTLVPHGAPADGKAKALFEELRAIGFETCILSNNKEPRVSPFANEVKSPYLFKANKPSKKGYEKAMERMGTSRETTVFVGGQAHRDFFDPRKAHQSQRGDPDRLKAAAGGRGALVLPAGTEKTEGTG